MASSKRSEKEIKDKRSQRFEYVGDKKVANELQEIEFQPSSLETIDRAMLRFIDEDLNLFTTTNDGFKKVPVLWVTAERAFQIKHNKDLRDKEETLILPLITVNRVNVTKEQNYRGTVFANLYPVNDAKGGTITVARQINQQKTAQFQNAQANRKIGGNTPPTVSNKMLNTNKRNMSTAKTVYETITIPIPTWIKVNYQISLRTEYQQQMNELIRPFLTIPGNSRTPKMIEAEGHSYEIFIDGGFSNNSNQASIGMEQRNYETDITIEVLGYLIGEGENQERPKIVKRENAVDIKLGRERTIVGDIPENIKDGFYRE
tara:strand:+ start:2973 stop:3923 length:951 start_codon:yes stop_codon:yes gene_type:complete